MEIRHGSQAVNSIIRERLILGQRSFIAVCTLQKPLQEKEQGVRPAALYEIASNEWKRPKFNA
jgi:hypothetical protein